MYHGINNIVWLASYPKSGNTWFRVFLQNLIEDTDEPARINMLDHSIIASDRELFNRYAGTNSSDLTQEEIRNLRPEVYKILAWETQDFIYIKVHDSWGLNSLNNPIFPEEVTKAVIYFIRNPLEISVSYAHHSNIQIEKSIERLNNPSFGLCMNPYKLYSQLQQMLLSWSEHVISWTVKSNLPVIIIRFEDMLKDTYNTFSKILHFVNLKYPEDRIYRAISNSKFEILQSQEKREGFREKTLQSKSFFRIGSADTWKTLLSKSDIEKIIKENYQLMEKYGYLL